MNRKEFIRLTSLGMASLPFLPYVGPDQPGAEPYDVLIIGAGLSGLTAANLLIQSGRKVLVLEAQGRVGGRTWSQPIGHNAFIDIGGQWIGKGHDSMYQLAREAGIETFPTYTTGHNLWLEGGKMKRHKGETPPIGLLGLLRMARAYHRFEEVSDEIDPLRPWAGQNASAYDNISLGTWLDQNIRNDQILQLNKRVAEGELCMSTYEVSMLQAAAAARSTGSLEQAESVEDGALRDRLRGGAQGICNFLFEKIKPAVKLSCPVRYITQLDGGIQVGNKDFTALGKKVIITAPLPVVKNITFTPELPHAKRMLIANMNMGTVLKCHAVYETPFWREAGLSGSSFSPDETVDLSVDNSTPDSETGILASLIHAERAETLLAMDPEDRKKTILATYARRFGVKAFKPIHFHEFSFSNNPWIGGAYSGYFKAGILSTYGHELATPCGNIFWAGTETSPYFQGFMEGAVLSGKRVAKEIIEKK